MDRFQVSWNYPTSILVGENRSKELPQLCMQWGMRKPLLVTDSGLAVLPMTQVLIDECASEGVALAVFSAIKPNPVGENVEQGVQAYLDGQHDGVVAFGGGSAMDAAKAIALMVGQTRPLWDFEDKGDNWLRVKTEHMAVVIAIPTTAGTGSEVGRASVITNDQEQRKVIIFHPEMLPKLVLLDPVVTQGLPAHITAATGMDALSHSLEAYCANYYHPMAEGTALESIRLIQEYLPKAYENGQNLEARQQMLVASTMGASAFQRGLGAMHAIAHSLGALYDAHHGLLNAVLMPYVLRANRAVIEDRMVRLSRYLDLQTLGFDGVENWVLSLRDYLAIPHSLSEIGIDDQLAEKIGQMSECDPSAGGNPITFNAKQYQSIFEAALKGRLEDLADFA